MLSTSLAKGSANWINLVLLMYKKTNTHPILFIEYLTKNVINHVKVLRIINTKITTSHVTKLDFKWNRKCNMKESSFNPCYVTNLDMKWIKFYPLLCYQSWHEMKHSQYSEGVKKFGIGCTPTSTIGSEIRWIFSRNWGGVC